MITMEDRLLQNDEDSKLDLEEIIVNHEYLITLIQLGILEEAQRMADFISKYTGEEIEALLDKAGQIDSKIESQVNSMIGNKANKSTSVTVTLASASWSGNTQTVSVTGVTDTNNVVVSPSGRDSTTAWADGEVLCTSQGSNTLTFTCTTVPTADITVSVVIIG